MKDAIDRGDWLRPILLVFMPFAAGYYLSYLFRAINAVVAEPLVRDLGLDATRLGFLSSVYFLTFAAVQLPVGAALDRFGPRRVQGTMLMLAAVGSVTFARATGMTALLIGRGLIGLGVAGALMAETQGHRRMVSERAATPRQWYFHRAGRGGRRHGHDPGGVDVGLDRLASALPAARRGHRGRVLADPWPRFGAAETPIASRSRSFEYRHDLCRCPILARCSPLSPLHRIGMGAARIVGCAVAFRCCWPGA